MLEGKNYQRNYRSEKKKKKEAETRKRTAYLMRGRKLKVKDKRSLAVDKNK
jgi:hypothetical protein